MAKSLTEVSANYHKWVLAWEVSLTSPIRVFLNIMPPRVPFPLFWVYFTGVCEIVGALGLWFSATRVWAWSLIALCIGVYPATYIWQ